MAISTNIRQQSSGLYLHYKPSKTVAAYVGLDRLIKRSLKTHSKREAGKRRDLVQGLFYLAEKPDFNPLDVVPELIPVLPEIIEELSKHLGDHCAKPTSEPRKAVTLKAIREIWLVSMKSQLDQATPKEQKNIQNSMKTMDRSIDAFLVSNGRLSDLPMKAIKKSHAASMRDHLLHKQKLALKTFRSYCTHLSKLWAIAAERDQVIGDSPFKSLIVEGAKKETKRLPFTSEQASVVSSLFNRQTHFEDWLAVNFYLTSGARREELFKVKKSDITETDKGLFIRIGSEGKTESALRVLPIHPKLAHYFKELIAPLTENELILSESRKRELDDTKRAKLSDAFGKRFSKRLRAIYPNNIELCLHSARHFFGTAADHADIDQRTAAQLAGNSGSESVRTPMILKHYSTGKNADQLNFAMEKVWNTDLMQQLASSFFTKKTR